MIGTICPVRWPSGSNLESNLSLPVLYTRPQSFRRFHTHATTGPPSPPESWTISHTFRKEMTAGAQSPRGRFPERLTAAFGDHGGPRLPSPRLSPFSSLAPTVSCPPTALSRSSASLRGSSGYYFFFLFCNLVNCDQRRR